MGKSNSVWLYFLLMFLFYILWSGVLPEANIVNQVVFNFGVFYPAGLIAGMKKGNVDRHNAVIAAVILTGWTYLLAWFNNIDVSLSLAIADVITMFVFLFIAFYVGRRSMSDKIKSQK